MDKEELLRLYNLPLEELLNISAQYVSNDMELCSLVNARNGKCSQNCKYCAQSAHYRTNIEEYPLISCEEVVQSALEAKANGAVRFGIVTSGKSPDEEDFGKLIEYIDAVNKIDGIRSCASMGILNEEQAKILSEHGLKRFHHNINTSETYYDKICTTHTWQDRYNTCKLIKKYGMELCCGVIIGMGETVEQRIEMALELRELQPDSIPVNILMPIPNTPLENYHDRIDEDNVMRTFAIMKIANPKSVIRLCGGRMRLSEENQQLALKYCIEGIITGNMLNTTGKTPEQDRDIIQNLKKNLVTNKDVAAV